MYTIYETSTFVKLADEVLTPQERQELCVFLAGNSLAGDVIPNSGGCRKLRWSRSGMGKRGGSRIIYYNMQEDGLICLLFIYPKSTTSLIPAHILKQAKERIEKWIKK